MDSVQSRESLPDGADAARLSVVLTTGSLVQQLRAARTCGDWEQVETVRTWPHACCMWLYARACGFLFRLQVLSQAAESDLLADAESEVAEAAEELAFRVVVFSMQAWRLTCVCVCARARS